MSLKHVHAFFVAAAIALAAICTAIAAARLASAPSVGSALAATASAAGVVLLIRYEVHFLRRWRVREAT